MGGLIRRTGEAMEGVRSIASGWLLGALGLEIAEQDPQDGRPIGPDQILKR